jgi:SAM-dependent methyltransferase
MQGQILGKGPIDGAVEIQPRKQYIEVPLAMRCRGLRSLLMRLAGTLLCPAHWLAALFAGGTGLFFHLRCAGLGWISLVTRRLKRGHYSLIFFPMDSTRYFEFGVSWERLRRLPFTHYLDVSSPRLLPLMLMRSNRQATADLINPDANDMRDAEKLFRAFGVGERCRFGALTVEQASFESSSFDLITCISVLEHIPADGEAVERMWSLLRTGGRLVLTLPCMSQPLEQYISYNQYGVLQPGSDGYTFWQRYYDEERLRERIYRVTGPPEHRVIFGEKTNGLFFRNATMKRVLGGRYPFWREPYMMATEYRSYPSLEELPGEGVVYLEFLKK